MTYYVSSGTLNLTKPKPIVYALVLLFVALRLHLQCTAQSDTKAIVIRLHTSACASQSVAVLSDF